MGEVLAAILGAVVGAFGSYLLDIRRAREERHQAAEDAQRERRRRRAAVATALLIDIRSLEWTLSRLAKNEEAAAWRGESPALMYDAVRAEIPAFAPEAVNAVMQFFGLVRDTYVILADAADRPKEELDDHLHWVVRAKATFALQRLGPAVDALVAEGGELPSGPQPVLVRQPTLPKLPTARFPIDPVVEDADDE